MIMEWLTTNKEWVFSGIGVFALGLVIAWLRRSSKSSHQMSQKGGIGSKNYQAGKDIRINDPRQ